MSQFYQKYKQLFEHDDYLNMNQAFEYGYPKNTQQPSIKQPQQSVQSAFTQHTYQNQPSVQYSPPQINKYNNNYEQPQQEQQQQQQRFNKYINTPPRQYAKQESPIISNNNIPTANNSRPSRNDELRYRKQVVQDNIFTPTPITYNNIPQQQQQQSAPVDILDVYVPKRIATAVVAPVEINIHRTYMQKMNDLDQLRKRYVDAKQLTNQLDPNNPYKYSLQKRILAQLGADRKQKLRGLLQQ